MANEETMIDKDEKDESLRYGISALDIKYKKYAIKDELLVQGTDGKMFYKREDDGQIVTSENLEYDKDSLISAINNTLLTINKAEVSDNDYLVYNIIDISGKNSLSKKTESDPSVMDLNISQEFSIKRNSGFFIRVRSDNVTNAAMSQLASQSKSEKPDVSITITVNDVDVIKEVKFNTLTLLKLDEITGSNTKVSIKFKNISFPGINEAFTNRMKNMDLKELAYENEKFEANAIDFIYYTDTPAENQVYKDNGKIRLQYTLPVNIIDTSPVIMSKNKPNHRCLWAKVIS